jgi:hypothetical protein
MGWCSRHGFLTVLAVADEGERSRDHTSFDFRRYFMSSVYVTTNGLAKSLGIGRRWLDRLKKAGILEYDLPNVRMLDLEKAKYTYLGYITRKLEKRNLL